MNHDKQVERRIGERVIELGARISALMEQLKAQPDAGSPAFRQELHDLASRQKALGESVQSLDEDDGSSDSRDQVELQEALAQLSRRVDEISESLK